MYIYKVKTALPNGAVAVHLHITGRSPCPPIMSASNVAPQSTPFSDGTLHGPRRNTSATGRNEHPEPPVIVYAKWTGYAQDPPGTKTTRVKKTHIYSTSIPPAAPLNIGMRVRVLATTPAWYYAPEEDPDTYEAYDAHIVGRITAVAGWKGRKIVLMIANECAVNPVRSIRLRLPFAPEVTVHAGLTHLLKERHEAQESDLNTLAVVRTHSGDARCGADACWQPWRRLVGEQFLWEPMVDDVGDIPGARRGRRKLSNMLRPVGWQELAGTH